jgi:hypothetical protein
MAMYNVSTPQLLIATVFSALIGAGSVVSYMQFKEKQSWPVVETSPEGSCVKVQNLRNGDAYNCEDVDVLLRQYKTEMVIEKKPKEEVPAEAPKS